MRTSDVEQLVEKLVVDRGDGAESLLCEGLSEDGGILDEPALVGRKPVESGRDQPVQRFRHVELTHRSGCPVAGIVGGEHASIDEHAHCLDGVERYSFGSVSHLVCKRVREAETLEERDHRVARERLEVDARSRRVGRIPSPVCARAAPGAPG